MKIFDLESKLETNLKQLDFYYELDSKIESKFNILIVLYSFIFVYIIELFKYFIDAKLEGFNIVFSCSFLSLLICLFFAIKYTYLFHRPEDVLYIHEPEYFYTTILENYRINLNISDDPTTDEEALLNEYVNHTYLREQEIALAFNIKAYREKRKKYYFNFLWLLGAAFFYVLTAGFVIFENRNENTKFELKNYKEILNYQKSTSMAEKPKIDPRKVITSQPIAVKQSGKTTIRPMIKPEAVKTKTENTKNK
ncbi:hypothetical protein K0U91_01125 [Chryseobacterium chendengshani]|uniref:hypothetical protein n=1 Tax=Chryseobacterium sp. LJ668 TaxID=2864040 RepID=UPI001C68CCEF|nr:hypothetical protein [Chryseobacterium sp. LJ668]MBW8523826.1 hypothetical protein [Chryseobacterium sp. LJ668]QYK16769.1 hypothetical protein K0U91_01125 [Chryseobacterium sp. LJ668]